MTAPQPDFKWSDCSTWLKGEHLDSQAHVVTIKHISYEEVHVKGKPTVCPIVYFAEWKPGLPLSNVNRDTLAALFGNNQKNCIGQRVTISPVPMKVAGKDQIPVRISAVSAETPVRGATQVAASTTTTPHGVPAGKAAAALVSTEPPTATQAAPATLASAPSGASSPVTSSPATTQPPNHPTTQPPTSPTAQQPNNGNGTARPYSPETVRAKLVERGNMHKEKKHDATDKQRNFAFLMLKEILMADDEETAARNHHSFIHFITAGWTSSFKELRSHEILALLDWIEPKQDTGGLYQPSPMAAQEAHAILREHLIEAGQLELPQA